MTDDQKVVFQYGELEIHRISKLLQDVQNPAQNNMANNKPMEAQDSPVTPTVILFDRIGQKLACSVL